MDLRDEWSVKGKDLSEFRKTCNMIAEETIFLPVSFNDISILSYAGDTIDKNNNPATKWRILSKETLNEFEKTGCLKKYTIINKSMVQEYLIDEAIRDVSFIIQNKQDKRHCYLVSKFALPTMSMKFKIQNEYNTEPSLTRNIQYAQNGLHEGEKNNLVTLVIRKDGGVYKIFSFVSTNYSIYPMNYLADMAEVIINNQNIGKVDLEWNINHSSTEIYLEFPDIANKIQKKYQLPDKIIPGIILRTSDIGTCPVSAMSTARLENSFEYIIINEITHKHTNIPNVEFLKNACNELFSQMEEMPKMMHELQTDEIGKYTDLTTKEGQIKNTEKVLKNLKSHGMALNLFPNEKHIRKTSILGQKRMQDILNDFRQSMNPEKRYTAYDICIYIMSIPELVDDNIHETRIKKMKKACGQCVATSYKKSRNIHKKEMVS